MVPQVVLGDTAWVASGLYPQAVPRSDPAPLFHLPGLCPSLVPAQDGATSHRAQDMPG